jgi:ADP-ribose pyrophosphatase YjhB (NUDIX family)
MSASMHFCTHCGGATTLRTPPGDNLPRQCCDHCDVIHYSNPKFVLGTLPVWEDKILLCRRAIEPRKGFWTLPAGFMENGETTMAAAERETTEEAGAHIRLLALYTLISVPHINQVHGIYRAELLDLDFSPGEETLEIRLFSEHEVPWEDIAFRTIALTLRHFFADRSAGEHYPFHDLSLTPPPAAPPP